MKKIFSIFSIALVGVFAVSCSDDEKTVTPTMNVTPTTPIAFEAAGDTVTITVTVSETGWTVTKTGEWFAISATGGETSGSFTVSAIANTSANELTGSIRIASTKEGIEDVIINVTQAGVAATMSVAPTTPIAFGAAGDMVAITVTVVETGWTVTKTGEWFAISATGGETSGSFTVSAAANTSLDELTGSIRIASTEEGIEDVTINVTQAGRAAIPAESVSLDVSAAHIYYLVAPTEPSVEKPATVTLEATVYPPNADDQDVTWSSSDNAIATVANGVVTAVKPGVVDIIVTVAEDITDTCKVFVTTECGFIIADADLATTHNFNAAQTACPEGWRLPAATELTCMCSTNSDGKDNDLTYTAGYYWSSTLFNVNTGIQVSFNHELVGIACTEVALAGMNSIARNVRCIKDVVIPE